MQFLRNPRRAVLGDVMKLDGKDLKWQFRNGDELTRALFVRCETLREAIGVADLGRTGCSTRMRRGETWGDFEDDGVWNGDFADRSVPDDSPEPS